MRKWHVLSHFFSSFLFILLWNSTGVLCGTSGKDTWLEIWSRPNPNLPSVSRSDIPCKVILSPSVPPLLSSQITPTLGLFSPSSCRSPSFLSPAPRIQPAAPTRPRLLLAFPLSSPARPQELFLLQGCGFSSAGSWICLNCVYIEHNPMLRRWSYWIK